jgi:serine/threonine protein kinase
MLPLTPTKLGRYEIVDEIGKGAMGVVYLARDPLIGRLVALKTFRIGYSVKDQELEQFRVRFIREAQSAGILTHPNIVTIHDVVEESGEGLAFIAMEYVRGTNLKLMLQGDQPLTLQFVIDVIAQVGEALDYAHSNRVVHRDVKPANILITAENRVKITDFGIARLDSSNLTQEGQLLGTPNYMSPEQIQGKEVDHRADLFSLGVVLYEMLTRHKPFQGENLTVVSHRIVYDHFTPPRDYIRDLPPGVEAILIRALEKDPARRYQRARDMVDDLRRALAASVAHESLNETQSLSSTLVLPPGAAPPAAGTPPAAAKKPSLFSRFRKPQASSAPAPAPPAADASGSRSASPMIFVPPPPPPPAGDSTMAASTPPLPAVQRPRERSVRRLMTAGGAALAASILFWAAALLWVNWSQPSVSTGPVAEQKQLRVINLLRQADQAMRSGDYAMAANYYRMALEIDPTHRGLIAKRANAQKWAGEAGRLSEEDQQIARKLEEARQAVAGRRYDAAVAAASAVLVMDPYNAEATEILGKSKQALARRNLPATPATPGQPPQSGEVVASVPFGTATEGNGERTEGESEGATAPVLRVNVRSEVGGIVIVSVDGREVVREPFRTRGGLLRRNKGSVGLTRTITMSPGTFDIRVHVTPDDQKAYVRNYTQNFERGVSRTLDIGIDNSAQVSVRLN